MSSATNPLVTPPLISEFPNLTFVKISGIGRDRIGITHKSTNIVTNHGGNILLHRSIQFLDEFAFSMIASFSEDNRKGPRAVMDAFANDTFGNDFVVFARVIDMRNHVEQLNPTGRKYFITVTGPDRMGIIESIALVLLQNGLNLIATESEVTHRPFQGTPIFACVFEVIVPNDFDLSFLMAELEEVESNTDLTILVRSE